MKKFFALALVAMLFSGICFAADEVAPVAAPTVSVPAALSITDALEKIPDAKQGILINFQDNEVEYLSTFEVAKYKNVCFELGYASPETIIGVVSYPVLKLKDLGITIPVLDLVECNVGLGAGFDRLNSAGGGRVFKYGLTITLINLKF
jgi:hypothetical protein